MVIFKGKPGNEEYIEPIYFGQILDVSRWTIRRYYITGKINNVRAYLTTNGMRYNLRDVLEYAYPYRTSKEIDELVRVKSKKGSKVKVRRKAKRGRK